MLALVSLVESAVSSLRKYGVVHMDGEKVIGAAGPPCPIIYLAVHDGATVATNLLQIKDCHHRASAMESFAHKPAGCAYAKNVRLHSQEVVIRHNMSFVKSGSRLDRTLGIRAKFYPNEQVR